MQLRNSSKGWNAKKKELWKKSPGQILTHIQEINTEILRIECFLRQGSKRQNLAGVRYMAKGTKRLIPRGNLRDLRHRKACLLTMYHTKMNQANKTKNGKRSR